MILCLIPGRSLKKSQQPIGSFLVCRFDRELPCLLHTHRGGTMYPCKLILLLSALRNVKLFSLKTRFKLALNIRFQSHRSSFGTHLIFFQVVNVGLDLPGYKGK